MDDLKLMGKTEEEIQIELQVVRNFSNDIHMNFGLDKCAEIVVKGGKLVYSQNLILQQRNTRAQTGKNIQVHRD
jgi:hypothetical protein